MDEMRMNDFKASFKRHKVDDGIENLKATNNTPITTQSSSYDTSAHKDLNVETQTTNTNVSDSESISQFN